MAEQYLTTGEFSRWTEHHDRKIDRILDHIEHQQTINIETAAALATLETKQTECAGGVNKRATWISSVVSAVVSGLMTWATGAAGGTK